MRNLFLLIAIVSSILNSVFFGYLSFAYAETQLESFFGVMITVIGALLALALIHIYEVENWEDAEDFDAYQQDYADRHLDSYRDEREH